LAVGDGYGSSHGVPNLPQGDLGRFRQELVRFGDEPRDVGRLEVAVEEFLAGPILIEAEMSLVAGLSES
jgi:hypothetical protein